MPKRSRQTRRLALTRIQSRKSKTCCDRDLETACESATLDLHPKNQDQYVPTRTPACTRMCKGPRTDSQTRRVAASIPSDSHLLKEILP